MRAAGCQRRRPRSGRRRPPGRRAGGCSCCGRCLRFGRPARPGSRPGESWIEDPANAAPVSPRTSAPSHFARTAKADGFCGGCPLFRQTPGDGSHREERGVPIRRMEAGCFRWLAARRALLSAPRVRERRRARARPRTTLRARLPLEEMFHQPHRRRGSRRRGTVLLRPGSGREACRLIPSAGESAVWDGRSKSRPRRPAPRPAAGDARLPTETGTP